MYITVDDIKNEILLINPIDNRNGDKKIGLIRAYFIFSFYNVKRDENIHLKNGEKLKVKKGCYTKRDIENVSAKKVRYDPLTGKSIIDPTISRFDSYMEKILGINNENYIDTLLSKKHSHLRLINCPPQIIYLIVIIAIFCIRGTLTKKSHLVISFILNQTISSIKS